MTSPHPLSAAPTAAELIAAHNLVPHPEGGFYRETFRSPMAVRLPDGRRRLASTAILFLLPAGEFSAWHTVAQDELWHWHAGGPLTLYTLTGQGGLQTVLLAPGLSTGRQPQFAVPAGVLQAAFCPPEVPYTLVGCTVAPGFEFADFVLPARSDLLARFPQHSEWIRKFTRP